MRPADLLRKDSVAPSQTARILLPALEWMFGVQGFNRSGKLVKWFRDPTSVQYVAEVMVSAGATEVLLDASFIDRRAVTALLAQPLRRRIKFFRSRRTHQFMSRLLGVCRRTSAARNEVAISWSNSYGYATFPRL